jgi:hypothetical protein
MRTTSAERMRALRARRRRGKVCVEVDLHEDDLREIALRGYEGAASSDRDGRSLRRLDRNRYPPGSLSAMSVTRHAGSESHVTPPVLKGIDRGPSGFARLCDCGGRRRALGDEPAARRPRFSSIL